MNEKLNSLIKVVGVGGGGCNAVDHMHEKGIVGVDFIICNTDIQSLERSKINNKVQLGEKGLGAGAKPEMGANATRETLNQILDMLDENTKMVFVTAGMGGGTGTGGAPIVAEECKKRGLLTVGICTTPFEWEGPSRRENAMNGIKSMQEHVDTLIIISNDKLEEMYADIDMDDAFMKADDVLATAAKGIAEIITIGGKVNVDFEDVFTVMENSGVAIMGTGYGSGEGRAMKAVKEALDSPLLNDNDIVGSKKILLNITYGSTGFKMSEFNEISRYVQAEAGGNADIIWGRCKDEALEDNLKIVLIATGFEGNQDKLWNPKPEVTDYILDTKRIINSDLDLDNNPSPTVMKDDFYTKKPADNNNSGGGRIKTFDLTGGSYDDAMRQIRENKDNNNINNSINEEALAEQTLAENEQPEYLNSSSDRSEKLQKLNFMTRPDHANLIKQKADYLKQRTAFEAKNVEFEKTLSSNQHHVSNTSVDMDEEGELKFKKNKFLHDRPC